MQLKLFIIDLPIGAMIISLILLSQLLTAAAELIDIEPKDKDIKQELDLSETKPDKENNTVNQVEEEQESNGDTRERGVEQNITVDDVHSSDDIPFVLPFDDILPFP
ncbi:MAG: hypothetical protein M3250_04955 [Thermoproteota archaeon]|nr:hypothetical protein [Thermoproteota archaeon]